MARWLVRRGARNLLLLSRSGATRDTAKELLAELEAVGAHVAAPPCDVTDLTALKHVLDQCQKTMPPVKGCIQGSMVLKVRGATSESPGLAPTNLANRMPSLRI